MRNRVKANPILKSSSRRALTASTCLSSNAVGRRAAVRIWLQFDQYELLASSQRQILNSRFFDVAEPGSFDLNAAVCLPGDLAYFTADVLSFKIAIGPDEQGL